MADFIKPNTAKYTSYFGKRVHPITGEIGKQHDGIDFSGLTDDVIKASASGMVSRTSNEGVLGGFGNFIMITHSIKGQVYTTVYAHLKSFSVKLGQQITQGQQIGIKGNTGSSTSKHLHFQLHKGKYSSNTAVDPLLYLSDPQIKELQVLLNKVGYKLAEDGISGESTTTAIKDFQKKNGIASDGIVGAYTIAKLKLSINKVDSVTNVKSNEPIWDGMTFKKGQLGRITIKKPINLWTDDLNGNLKEERVLRVGEVYRVYGYRNKHGGQYDVGGGLWITKILTHIRYETPSLTLLNQAKEFYS